MSKIGIPYLDFDALISAIQALSAPSGTDVAIDATGMEIITATNAQGALKQLDTAVDEVNASLTNLSNVVDGCITWRSKVMPDITMQANSTGSASLDVNTLAGYKPIGIIGYTGTGTTGTVMQECYMTSTYKAFVYLRNMTNAQKTVSSVTVNVLYIKDDII